MFNYKIGLALRLPYDEECDCYVDFENKIIYKENVSIEPLKYYGFKLAAIERRIDINGNTDKDIVAIRDTNRTVGILGLRYQDVKLYFRGLSLKEF